MGEPNGAPTSLLPSPVTFGDKTMAALCADDLIQIVPDMANLISVASWLINSVARGTSSQFTHLL